MSSVGQLEAEIYNLALELASRTRVSDVAAIQVVDACTLAVIPYSERNFARIAAAIEKYSRGCLTITRGGSVIWISLARSVPNGDAHGGRPPGSHLLSAG